MEVCSDENRLSIGGRRKTSRRRSSILKGGKSPTRGALEDRDPNVQQENDTTHTGITTRSSKSRQSSSRRVSFACKDEVKEFRVEEWDPVWNKDNEKVETCIATQECQNESGYRQPASTIKGLDSLLTGNIQCLPEGQRHKEITSAPVSDGRQSTEMGLDLTSCNGPGFLSESIHTGHYTENTESVDQTLCYGQGILNQEMPQGTGSTQADLTCMFDGNAATLDITRCHGWGIQDQEETQKQTNDSEGCGLDLTCHDSCKISLKGNETRTMAGDTNAFNPANQDVKSRRKPLSDVKPVERNEPQLPFPKEEKLDGKAFLARLQSSSASSKQRAVDRLGDPHSLFTDTNQQPKESREEKEGSVNVRDFLSRLSSKPLLDEQKQKSEPFDYEDDEVEFTVCHGTGIEGSSACRMKEDRRSIYKAEDIDFTICQGQGVFHGLETMTPISPLNPVVAERQEKTLSKVDESYDDDEATATMDLTGCVDSFHHIQHLTGFALPNYGTNTDAVHTTTCGNNSLIDSRDPLHPNFEVEPMDMTMTTCVSKLLPENLLRDEEFLPNAHQQEGNFEGCLAMKSTCIDELESHVGLNRKPSKRESLAMDMTTCIGNYEETVGSRGQPPETLTMDMTSSVGVLEQAVVQKGKPSSRESLAMDMTGCLGNLDQANVQEGIIASKEFITMDITMGFEDLQQSNTSKRKPAKRESLAMDMTTCVGNLDEVDVQRGKPSSNEYLAMDMTKCIENLDPAGVSRGKPSKRESIMMDMTTCVGTLEHSSLKKREPSSRESLGMDMTCVGSLEQSVIPGVIPSNRKSLAMDMTIVGDVKIESGDNGKIKANLAKEERQMDMLACQQSLSVGDIPTSSFTIPVATVAREESQSTEVAAQNSSYVSLPASSTHCLAEKDETNMASPAVIPGSENAEHVSAEVQPTPASVAEEIATGSKTSLSLQSFCSPSQSVSTEDGHIKQTTLEIQEHSPIPREDPKLLMYTNLFGPIDDKTLEHMETDINKSMSVLKSKLSQSIASGKLQLPEFPALSQPSTQPEYNSLLSVSKLCSQFGRKRTNDHSVLKTTLSSPKETSILDINKSWDTLLSNDTTSTVTRGNSRAEEDSTENDNSDFQPSLPKVAKLGDAQQGEKVIKESSEDALDQMSPDNESCVGESSKGIMEESLLKMDFTEELATFQAESCSDDLKILDELNCQQTSSAPLTTEKLNKGRMGRTERLGSNLSVITEESYCATGSTGHSTTSSDEEALSEPTKEEPSVSPSMTVEEFLSSTDISFGLHRVRRSMIPPIQNVQPKETRDFILQLCYIKPKADLYGETIADIETEIEKLKAKVEAQEQQLNASNPMVFQQVRECSPAELSDLKQQLQKMQHTCKKHAMMNYTERKIKMKRQLKTIIKEKMEQLQLDIDALDEYTSMADSCIHMLDDIDKEVTNNISGLRKTAASNRKKLERVSKHQQTSQQHLEEMNVKQEELAALEEKRSTLLGEKQELVSRKASLEREEIETTEKIRSLTKQNNLKPELKDMTRKYNSLRSLHEWTMEEWDWSEGATFTFLEDTLHLVLLFGKRLDVADDTDNTVSAGQPALKEVQVVDVRLDSRLTDDSELSEKLAHSLVRQATETLGLQQICPTTASLPQLLEQLSDIVYTARLVGDEAWRVSLSHLSSLSNNTYAVEFSSLKAFTKFIVEFQFDVSVYPKTLQFKVTPKIGRVTEEDVEQLLRGVAPGRNYLKRLVGQADTFLGQLKSTASR